jgi:hypothetical protein
MASKVDLIMFKGKAWSRNFTVFDKERKLVNLDNAEGIAFTVKDDMGQPDEDIMIQCKLNDGIEVVTVEDAKKAQVIVSAERANISPTNDVGVYDLQVKMVGEEAEVVCYGQITFKNPVLVGEPV